MYLNICTYMSQQMQLLYTETTCFGENKWTQKITQNTVKYILRRATKVMIAKYRGWCRKKKLRAVFLTGFTKNNDAHLQSFFARNAGVCHPSSTCCDLHREIHWSTLRTYMCNTARSFTHESNTYVIRRLAFTNLGFIDLLSCNPLPATLQNLASQNPGLSTNLKIRHILYLLIRRF